MSEPLIIPPTCQLNCAAQSPSNIDCQTAYMWEELEEDFTMPASGGTGTIVVCNSDHYVTGGYIWLQGCGWLEITAKPNATSLTVRNNNTFDNAAALSVIAATARFVHLPPVDSVRWLEGSDTWDPGSIADGNEEAKEVTVTGAALGDFVLVSFSLDVTDLALVGSVTAANTVTVLLLNNTGGAIDLAEGTVRARVLPM